MDRRLIVGLGNPGSAYARHRHSIGFRIIDAFAAKHAVPVAKKSFDAEIGEGVVAGQRVLLAKPMSFMNNSGFSVKAMVDFYKIAPAEILVVHDDLDLDLGRFKWVEGRGHGGHNGIRSIMDELATTDFFRLRIGIGRPVNHQDPADYVLMPFGADEEPMVEEMIARGALAIEEFLQYGLAAVQQTYH